MLKREVWFAIPSANPEKCRRTLPLWRAMGYKVAVLQNYERGQIPADKVVWSDSYPGWPGSINILCRDVVPKTADIVVSGGDDMLPDPKHDAQELARQFFERFPDGFGVMQPHGDAFMEAKRYCGSPFLGRRWIDTMYGGAGPMCADYRHNWADNELYWVAKGLGALWERTDLSHFHDHFTRTGEDKPAYWKEAVENRDLEDCRTYINRSWSRFPGHQPKGLDRPFDASVLGQGAMHLAEIRMAMTVYAQAGAAARNCGVEDALRRCAAEGRDPVAIYGSGVNTLGAAQALARTPVRVACVIDDDASKQGRSLWGFPIVSREDALRRGVKAVVLSSTLHEGAMWDNCAEFRERGVLVLRVHGPSAEEKVRRVSEALDGCAQRGRSRVALYGAGAHTRAVAEAVRASPVEVVCVIDDDPVLEGQRVLGLPVVATRRALEHGVEAVVLSSDRHEDSMWEATRPLRRAGVEVVALYTCRSGATAPTSQEPAVA